MGTKMKIKDKEFLIWFFKRLVYKHDENNDIVQKLNNFLSQNIMIPKQIDIKIIDKVCKKFYPDFDIEKAPDLSYIGWSEKERDNTRLLIIETIKELSQT